MKISDYFNTNVRDSNLYANYRVIPGIDGLKNTQRKCLYVMQSQKQSDKVSNMASIISRETEYLHGNTSIEQVLSSLNVNYEGSGNNLVVLKGKGQFGSKFNPDAIGASRYVYTSKGDIFDYLYRKEDIAIYDEVYFEGTKIEPKTLLPVLIPLYNMQYSIGSGFASFLLPRNPKDLANYLIEFLNNGKSNIKLMPSIKGWNGSVDFVDGKYIFKGIWKKLNTNRIEVTELKPFIGLEGYLIHLDKLIENKVIKSYQDESLNGEFKFILSIPATFWEEYDTEDKIYKVLNLTESLVENITMFNENNKIVEYSNIEDYIKYFIDWRLKKYGIRQKYFIDLKEKELNRICEKYRFIKYVLEGRISFNNITKDKLLSFLKSNNFKNANELAALPLFSFTEDEAEKLESEIDTKTLELKKYSNLQPKDIWISEIKELLDKI